MTEIIIQLKEKNHWVVTCQGENSKQIAEAYSSKRILIEKDICVLNFNTYMLSRFIYWLKHQNFEIEYKELV